jgi:hypothetical protein
MNPAAPCEEAHIQKEIYIKAAFLKVIHIY